MHRETNNTNSKNKFLKNDEAIYTCSAPLTTADNGISFMHQNVTLT